LSISKIVYMAIAIAVLYMLFTVGFPFLMALLIALLLEPVIQFFSNLFKTKRILVSLAVCSAFSVLIFGAGYLVIVKGVKEGLFLSKSIISFISDNYQDLTQYTGDLQSFLDSIFVGMDMQATDITRMGIDSLQSFLANLTDFFFNLLQGVPNIALDFLIFIIALFLISFSLPTMKGNILALFDPSSHHKIELVMSKLYQAVLGFIRAQIIISFIVFSFTLIFLLILGVKYALIIAIIIMIVDILPILGTGATIIPMSVFYLFMGDYFIGFGLLILHGSLIAIRRIIEPKILGDAIGIGALSALASMYIGFKLAGVIGLFFGPAAVILVQSLIHADILKIKIKF